MYVTYVTFYSFQPFALHLKWKIDGIENIHSHQGKLFGGWQIAEHEAKYGQFRSSGFSTIFYVLNVNALSLGSAKTCGEKQTEILAY